VIDLYKSIDDKTFFLD